MKYFILNFVFLWFKLLLAGKFFFLDKDDKDELDELSHKRNEDGTITTYIKKAKKKTLSWKNWTEAWNLYAAILYEEKKEPNLPTYLAMHFKTVSHIQKMGKNWQLYDEQFRKMVARGKSAWGQQNQMATKPKPQ